MGTNVFKLKDTSPITRRRSQMPDFETQTDGGEDSQSRPSIDLHRLTRSHTCPIRSESIQTVHSDEEFPAVIEMQKVSQNSYRSMPDVRRQVSIAHGKAVFSSTSSASDGEVFDRWTDNSNARETVSAALSVFYAFILLIFGLVLELAHLLARTKRTVINVEELVFSLYMYGGSIVFFLYCYLILLFSDRQHFIFHKITGLFRQRHASSASSKTLNSLKVDTGPIVTHDSTSAGSLFLRLGCVVFGVIGTVFYGFSTFLCLNDRACNRGNVVLDICALVFIFVQMHFIFSNHNIRIIGHHNVARFGLMHLVAVNVWSWIKYVLIEEGVLDKEIHHVFTNDSHVVDAWVNDNNTTSMPDGRIAMASELTPPSNCTGASCILGSVKNIMYTSIVEYSLIGAVVMFIVWRKIGSSGDVTFVKRKHQIRVNCSHTTSGLFLGIAFLVFTFCAMTIFYALSVMGENQTAAIVFSATDIIQYVLMSIACVFALWQSRLLSYHETHSEKKQSQELLDMILLALGMIGEMVYSTAGLLGLSGSKQWQPLLAVLLTSHVTRLVQVGLQCCFIYIGSHLRLPNCERLRKSQPGKQVLTFLLVANISMFFMNLLESEKAGISEAVVNFYGKKSWVYLVRSFSPLTIFYRFHSSVCLAEVWKNVYAIKD